MKNLSPIEVQTLVAAAREGTGKAFLTRPGGNSYGAAVMTLSGHIFSCGQYSSFNHITNIHAEMAAVLVATMAGHPDICAIAVLSEKAEAAPESICGVCRQFLHEHSLRTGIPITAYMADFNGDRVVAESLSNLLPGQWEAAAGKTSQRIATFSNVFPGRPETLCFGMLVVPREGCMGIVWEPEILPGQALVKLKYVHDGSSPVGLRKLSHSFHEYERYLAELETLGLRSTILPGIEGCLMPHGACLGFKPAARLYRAGLSRIAPLFEAFTAAGISLSQVSLTASQSAGHAGEKSDYDLVVVADADRVRALRGHLLSLFRSQKIVLPENSSTWHHLRHQTGREPQTLVQEGRYIDSFLIPAAGDVKCSLIFVHPQDQFEPLEPAGVKSRATFRGRVFDAALAPCKRSRYRLQTDAGQAVRVVSWHKLSNLLQEGDSVEVAGTYDPARETLYQICSVRDFVHLQ